MAAAAAASSAASKSRVATEQSYCLTDARALSLMTLFSPDEGKRAQSTAAAASAAAASTSASNSSTSFHLSQTVHCNVVGYSPDSSLHTFALHGVPERILAARRVDSTSQGQAAQFSYLIKWMRLPPRSATWISWETVALHIDMHKLALNQQNNRHPERVSLRGGDAQTTNAAGCTVVLTHQQQKAKWRAVEEHGLGAWGAIASLIRAFHRKHVDRAGNFKPPKPTQQTRNDYQRQAQSDRVSPGEAQLLLDVGFKSYVASAPPCTFLTRACVNLPQRPPATVDTLYEEFHPTHIYPERICALVNSNALVKWKNLPYNHCTAVSVGSSSTNALWHFTDAGVRTQIAANRERARRAYREDHMWTPNGPDGYLFASRCAVHAARCRVTARQCKLPTQTDADRASNATPYIPNWIHEAFVDEAEAYKCDETAFKVEQNKAQWQTPVDGHATVLRQKMGLCSTAEVIEYSSLVEAWSNAKVDNLVETAEMVAKTDGGYLSLKDVPVPPAPPAERASITPLNLSTSDSQVSGTPWGAVEVRALLRVLLMFAVSLRVEHKCLGATLIVCPTVRVAETFHGALDRHFASASSCLFVPTAWRASAAGKRAEPPLNPSEVKQRIINAVMADDNHSADEDTWFPGTDRASSAALSFADSSVATKRWNQHAECLEVLGHPAEELALIGELEMWGSTNHGYTRPACDVVVTTLEALELSRSEKLDDRVAHKLTPDAVKHVHRWEAIIVVASARDGSSKKWTDAVHEELVRRNLEVGFHIDAVM
ncbi:Chromo domain-containing protein [Pycnococcus provasolii]